MRHAVLLFASLALLTTGCKDSTPPVVYGAPSLLLVNGVTKPSGIVGMTVILEGTELAESRYGTVYFLGSTGAAIRAEPSEWTNDYILAAVPNGIATASKVWVQTRWGTTDTLDFTLASGAAFSPSNINWTRTADLPQALQGLDAVFVPVEHGTAKAKYIFTVGGATSTTNIATDVVYRGTVEETGAISTWSSDMTVLPAARAYAATAVATPYTARIDTTNAAYVYVIGGVDATGAPASTVLYSRVALDGTLGTWQTTTAYPAALHSAAARVYRGYVYVTGGANAQNQPTAASHRAKVNADGTLGTWEPIAALPQATAHHSMTNFGPYLYVVGGDVGAVAPGANALSGTETNAVHLARINMRDGTVPSWSAAASPGKARSKHSAIAAGGSVLTTSGLYSGSMGSSENTYASVNGDGSLSSWGGATGSNTIHTVLGYSLYNQAAVSFVDATGQGHVLVLGGGNRSSTTGEASAAVLYY